MLEVSGATCMWYGSDFHPIEQFGFFLNAYIAGAFNAGPFFDRHKEQASRLWLGNLGLLGAVESLEMGPGRHLARRWKRESLLPASRVAPDPESAVDKILATAQAIDVAPHPNPPRLELLSDDETEAEVLEYGMKAKNVLKARLQAALRRIEKRRTDIARVYPVTDIVKALRAVFRFPCDLELTFKLAALIKRWTALQNATGVRALPRGITEMPIDLARADRATTIRVINAAIWAAGARGLSSASIGYCALLHELEVCINQRQIPTAGATLALDLDHATAALDFDAFVCRDRLLAENIRVFLCSTDTQDRTVVCAQHPKAT